MAGEGEAPPPPPPLEPINRNWEDCSPFFRDKADEAIRELDLQTTAFPPAGAGMLAGRFPGSPLAHSILAHGCRERNLRTEVAHRSLTLARHHLGRAAELASGCPLIALALAETLDSMGLSDQAVAACDRAFDVTDHTVNVAKEIQTRAHPDPIVL